MCNNHNEQRKEFHYSGQTEDEQTDRAAKMDRIQQAIEKEGLKTAIVFTNQGMITFGAPIEELAIWLHQKEHFEADVLPLIVEQIPEALIPFIIHSIKH